MVSVSSLDKVSPNDTYSEPWQVSQPFSSKDQKIAADERGRNDKLHGPRQRFVDPNGKSCADLHPEQPAYNMDRCLASANGANNETSLFSSSLSDLFNHKLRMSASKSSFHQSASNADSQTGNMGSLKRVEETESQAINNLLPDEDDLLSGVIGLGHVANSNNEDDLDDFDLFSCTGGIELEADERIWTGNKNLDFNKGISYSQWAATVGSGSHHAAHLHSAARLLNGGSVERGSPHKSSGVENTFHSPSFPASVGNQFSLCQPSYSPGRMNLENQYFQDFHSHSLPDVHNRVVNVVPWNPLDNISDGFSGSPQVTGEISRDLRQVDLSGKPASLNGRAYGYSGNGSLPVQMGWSLSGKPDLYEQHPSRSAVWPNSPSFPNAENAHYAVQPPGFRKLPHAMMKAVSPLHLQVGSAPVNAAFWDPLETFADLSMQSKSNQSLAMHCGSPSHPADMSSQHTFPRAGGTCVDLSKHAGLLSQMSPHAFNGRNPSISMQSSFAFPGERVRNRANSGNIDKKNYELNIDRILRGEDRRTTLMIKNIPNKYTSKMLLATIDELHKGTYDFIYLPIDFKNKCNVGYAFINMVDPKHIVSFYQTFNGKRWEKFNSEKVASLAYARIQGKSALVAHFQNSSLMNEDKRCRPILFHTEGPNAGDQEPFPTSGNFRLRGSRAHTSFEQEMEGRSQMKE